MSNGERLHYVRVCEKLAAETHAREAAEAELRETVSELETLRANFTAMDLDEPLAAQRKLDEAIALLEELLAGADSRGMWGKVEAFLKSSRTRAQPAAPHSEEDCDGSCYVQPAAPEPSAEPVQSFDLLGRWRTRAETAEAKLAAVRDIVRKSNISHVRADDAGRLANAIRALLTPAGPNGGAK